MKKDILFFTTVFLIAVLLLYWLGRLAWPKKEAQTNTNSPAPNLTILKTPTIVYGNPSRGAKNPKVTIVEFGNYLCQPCGEMEVTLKQLLKDFPTQLRVVWKDLPDLKKPAELSTALATRCSQNQGLFWEYHDLLFINQPQAYSSTNLTTFASLLKLDPTAFSSCLNNATTQPIIERDIEEAIRLRLDGTPYLFINGERVSGALGYNELKQLVVNELEKPMSNK